jgi:hypothetical protein
VFCVCKFCVFVFFVFTVFYISVLRRTGWAPLAVRGTPARCAGTTSCRRTSTRDSGKTRSVATSQPGFYKTRS